MTSALRINALVQAVEHVVANNLPGDIVECGVWKGGSMLAAARTLVELGDTSRTLHLFDTFEGMTAPSSADCDFAGREAAALLSARSREDSQIWAYSPLDEVKSVMARSEYPAERVRYIVGDVAETIPAQAPGEIAILRLDTDWYESTRHELEHLFPRLTVGGILIIDDYGAWKGARQAVDEFVTASDQPIFLNRIDETARLVVKPDPEGRVAE